MRRLLRRRRDDQGLRIREPDVLSGEDDDATRDEHRILARVDHPHEPVERGVGIRATHALDERADRVVVHVAGAVVEQAAALHRLADVGQLDRPPPVRPWRERIERELERVQGDARITVGNGDECVLRIRCKRYLSGEPALVGHRAAHDRAHVVLRKRLQHVYARARQERGIHFERGVLRRSAEEGDVAVLDVRQNDVLLRLVEAMDLVDEQDGALVGQLPQLAGLLDDLAQLDDAAGYRGDRDEAGLRFCAAIAASVVLPVPGGPHRIIDGICPASIARRSMRSWPTRCGCPTNSARSRGRMRAASGWADGISRF